MVLDGVVPDHVPLGLNFERDAGKALEQLFI